MIATVLYCPQCLVDIGEETGTDDAPARRATPCALYPKCAPVPAAAAAGKPDLAQRAGADAATWERAAAYHDTQNQPRLKAQAEAAARALRKYAEIAGE